MIQFWWVQESKGTNDDSLYMCVFFIITIILNYELIFIVIVTIIKYINFECISLAASKILVKIHPCRYV